MAKNDTRWDLGEIVSVTGSGSSPGDGDDKWNLGQNVLFYEYTTPIGGAVMAAIYYRILLAGDTL